MISIILNIILFGFIIYYYIRYKQNKKYESILEKFQYDEGTGKEGVVDIISKYSSLYGVIGTVEVLEIKTAGNKTKVRILNVVEGHDRDGEIAEKNLNVGETRWVVTDAISWLDNWEKNKRNRVLNELLNEEK